MLVPTGAAAPDISFETAGRQASLLDLRGRDVTLCFYRYWSEPSRVQLRYLQATQPEQTALLAIGDAEERPPIVEVQRSTRGEVHHIVDSTRRIATAYGVPCWPTTVRITADGRVGRVTYGMSSAARQWAKASGERRQPKSDS
jgi:hypothetical protein